MWQPSAAAAAPVVPLLSARSSVHKLVIVCCCGSSCCVLAVCMQSCLKKLVAVCRHRCSCCCVLGAFTLLFQQVATHLSRPRLLCVLVVSMQLLQAGSQMPLCACLELTTWGSIMGAVCFGSSQHPKRLSSATYDYSNICAKVTE